MDPAKSRHPFRKDPSVTVQELTDSEPKSSDIRQECGDATDVGNTWRPGWTKQFPLVSFICVWLVLGIIAGIILVLVLSDGKNVDTWCAGSFTAHVPWYGDREVNWAIEVNVWISAFVFFAGKLMAVVYTEAATIVWWTSALRGSTIRRLIHQWEVSKSITPVLLKPKQISWICLASVAFTLFAGVGSIFQKATSTRPELLTFNSVSMSATMADRLPIGFSGVYNQAQQLSFVTPGFLQIVREHVAHTPIEMSVSNCSSVQGNTCSTMLTGIGFEYDCTAESLKLPAHSSPVAHYKGPYSNKGAIGPPVTQTLFDVKVEWPSIYELDLSAVWKSGPACDGQVLSSRQCKLTPALVRYPVTIEKGIVTLSPASSPPNWKSGSSKAQDILVDEIARPLSLPDPRSDDGDSGKLGSQIGGLSTYGGVYKVLDDLFTSSIKTTGYPIATSGGWVSLNDITGPLTSTFAVLNPEKDAIFECNDITMPDPMHLLTSTIRDIMFRSSVAIVQRNITDTFEVIEAPKHGNVPSATFTDSDGSVTIVANVYQTRYAYMAGGIAAMVAIILTILPLFWGFWNLGRPVSLSPLELARAFHSTTVAGTAEDKETAQSGRSREGVQHMSVFDAAHDSGSNTAEGSNATTKELIELFGEVKIKYGEVGSQKLGFGLQDRVDVPQRGSTYR